jgi:hypothetical protein
MPEVNPFEEYVNEGLPDIGRYRQLHRRYVRLHQENSRLQQQLTAAEDTRLLLGLSWLLITLLTPANVILLAFVILSI